MTTTTTTTNTSTTATMTRGTTNAGAARAPAPAADADITELSQTQHAPAATFEPARSAAPKRLPFQPPASPALVDEDKATSWQERKAIRAHNQESIKAYNKEYATYLETYAQAVMSAPNLNRVHHFGEPAPYAPDAGLPASQRAAYGSLHDPKLAVQRVAYDAIGERVARARGEKDPGFYLFAEGKLKVRGQSYAGRIDNAEGELKAKQALSLGVTEKDTVKLDGTEYARSVGMSQSIDLETGKSKTQVSVNVGGLEVDANSDGKLGIGYSVGLDNAKVGAGSSYDPKNARTEVHVKAGVELSSDVKLEGKVGVGFQFLSPEQVERAIDPTSRGFFDADVAALRVGGR
jgi:hypothetical protein